MAYVPYEMSRAMLKFVVIIGFIATACATKKNPALMCPGGQCSDPRFPYCDVDGTVGGTPNACLAVSCTAGGFIACDQDNAIVCSASGSNYESTSCPTGCSADTNGCKPCSANTTTCGSGELDVCDGSGMLHPQQCAAGCVDTPAPHCAYIEPRYVPDACDMVATQPALAITNSGSLDPNLDSNCTGGIVTQTAAPAICVVHYGTIDIAAGATLTVPNTLDAMGRTIALVADQDLTIEGTLDVSAHGTLSGAGGGFNQSGADGTPTTAAGGAGGATPGAPGGSTTADGGGSNGGAAQNDPGQLAVLLGGAAAFQVADGTQIIGGGGGGGGVTLISCRGTVNVSGTISAGGGGGIAGASTLLKTGFGGGAGGYVVLQGLGVSVTGSVFANGGGGGGGEQPNMAAGQAGQDGTLSDVTAARGGFPQGGEGAGGAGGIATLSPTAGKKPTASGAMPGGGGGSVGWFQTYTPQGVSPTLMPAHASPTFRPNGNASTR